MRLLLFTVTAARRGDPAAAAPRVRAPLRGDGAPLRARSTAVEPVLVGERLRLSHSFDT